MNLYIKYRPKDLDEVVGNDDVMGYLKGFFLKGDGFSSEDSPHVFLLHGPTGCGKTTVARIMAHELGCGAMDFKEINMADFRGIDTARELIRTSRYKALEGDVRVWLIDEAHRMTGDAQNALLKLLEDTPDHTYYLLATTEPEKLLPTVKGRCVQLKLQPLNDRQMFGLLRSIVKAEGKRLTKSVYAQIIQDALGLPRNALQVLERVLAVPEEQQLAAARQAAEQYSQSIELCRALLGRSGWRKVANILKGLKDQDAESVRRHVLGYAQAVLLNEDNEKAAHVIEEFWEPLYNIGFPGLVFACYSIVKT